MNLLLLPKELQVLISEFNVEHRPIMRVLMRELLVKYKQCTDNDKYCLGCGCLSMNNIQLIYFGVNTVFVEHCVGMMQTI